MCRIAINIVSFVHLLKRVAFNVIVDHLALMHIINSKAELTTTRINIVRNLSTYSFNLYYIKGKDMVLSDFLSKYYNIGKEKVGKYLVQTGSQVKSNGISLPKGHGVEKGLDPNVLPEIQIIKPIVTSEVKGTSQIKPRLGQGRAGLRWKIKTPMPPVINKPIVKLTEKPIEHPKVF